MMDYFTYGKRAFIKDYPLHIEKLKKLVSEIPHLAQKNFNFDNLQENFIFIFNETGHTVHNRRGEELGPVISCYLETLEIIE